MPTDLRIETFCLGDWMTNCYVVAVGEECWIVDAGFDPEPMIHWIRREGLNLRKVVLTHAHVDHIAGLEKVQEAVAPVSIPILIHEAEESFLTDPGLNLSAVLPEPIRAPEASGRITHGQTMHLGEQSFEVRHTPGHSPGGVTLYEADSGVALVGDALFAGSIGRTDFPGSSYDQLVQGIHDQLLTLPDQTRVLPGHGPETTIGHERVTNPFL